MGVGPMYSQHMFQLLDQDVHDFTNDAILMCSESNVKIRTMSVKYFDHKNVFFMQQLTVFRVTCLIHRVKCIHYLCVAFVIVLFRGLKVNRSPGGIVETCLVCLRLTTCTVDWRLFTWNL